MSECRSGCREKSHASYAECLRAANPVVNLRATPNNSWDRELETYRDARSQGIQPATTRLADVQKALDVSDRTGVAFDAGAAGGIG